MNIDEKTKISLWAVLVAVPTLCTFVFWCATMYSTAVNAERVNIEQEIKIKTVDDKFTEIRDRLMTIETNQRIQMKGHRDK